MFHPLSEDISKLKIQDLENKIQDLTKKYFISSRYGNSQLAQQVLLLLDMYKEEQAKRQNESLKKTLNKSKDLDELVKTN